MNDTSLEKTMKIPIAFPHEKLSKDNMLVLAADVGGTKTHFALYKVGKDSLELIREEKFASQKHSSFKNILELFQWNTPLPDALSIAFAGPILNGHATATNLPWSIDLSELSKELKFKNIFLINDLQANAYGLAALQKEELHTLHEGDPSLKGNAAIIAPGTGLGEAGLFWDGKALHPYATEGGHTDFGPHDEIDDQLLDKLRSQFGHVSWERMVSGPGIWNIYEFLREQEGVDLPDWMEEKCKTIGNAAAVSHGATSGDPICKKAMDLFFKYLAEEAANLSVSFNATGGLFIGGGVVPKNLHLLNKEIFMEHFYDKGRMHPMLRQVPIHIVLNDKTALLGAIYYGAYAIG